MTAPPASTANALVDALEAIVWELDKASGNYRFVSAHAERLLGHARERWMREPGFFAQHVHGDDLQRVLDARAQALAGRAAYVCDYRMLAADGRTVWLRDCAGAAGRDDRGMSLRGLTLELAETKALEAQLLSVQKTETLGRLVGGVAHDFNNLLMAMNGYADIVVQLVGADHGAAPHLEELKKLVERGTTLVRQLLSFSRRQEAAPGLVNLNRLVDGMAKMLRRLIGEDIQISIALKDGLGLVRADVGQVEQVLMNLAVNGRDAMPHGGQLFIETDSAEWAGDLGLAPGPYVTLRVRDTGCGMDQETLANIFQPFFTTKPAGAGTGLGLSIVQRVVQQSGGAVRVQSAPGQGTTFEAYLPLAAQAATAARPSDQPKGQGGSETLLVVEDDGALRESLCGCLRSYGYTVLDAAGGREAIELAERHRDPIHLVLADVVMPEMSGPDLVRLLTSLHAETRVIYMSGHNDHALVSGLLSDQRVPFLEKPFGTDEMARRVRETLGATSAD